MSDAGSDDLDEERVQDLGVRNMQLSVIILCLFFFFNLLFDKCTCDMMCYMFCTEKPTGKLQRCADPEILSPLHSAHFEQGSASASATGEKYYIGSTVSPRSH